MSTIALDDKETTFMPRPPLSSDVFEMPNEISVNVGQKLRTGVPIVTGFIPAGALVPENYIIPHHDPRTKKGYQRLPQDARINELANDLKKGRVDLPTSILLNLRNREARQALHDGTLDLRVVRGRQDVISNFGASNKFYVVDGQHRILALLKLIGEDESWRNFLLPFVCMLGATEEEEMDQFYVVNSKAKSVRTDLAFEILRQRAEHDPKVMNALIEKGQDWQVLAQEIVQRLSEESPVWNGRIRFAGMDKGNTIMPSASMVTSLKPLLNSPSFKMLSTDHKVQILDAFWRALRNMMLDAFDSTESFSIQKGLGVMVMHQVLVQVLEIVRAEGLPLLEPSSYEKMMKDALSRLQGENSTGNVVSGMDFWRAAPEGAAGAFSSSSGRRLLIARILQLLPKVSII